MIEIGLFQIIINNSSCSCGGHQVNILLENNYRYNFSFKLLCKIKNLFVC